MSPMPIGASIAMMLSLFVALTVTPYLGYQLLKVKDNEEHKEKQGMETSKIYRIYKKIEQPFLDSGKKRSRTDDGNYSSITIDFYVGFRYKMGSSKNASFWQ